MIVKLIATEEDYEKALACLEKIFDAKPDTKDAHEAERLVKLIDEYENSYYPIEAPEVRIV